MVQPKKEEEDKDNRENKDVDFYHCKSKRWIVKNNKDVFNKRKETLQEETFENFMCPFCLKEQLNKSFTTFENI